MSLAYLAAGLVLGGGLGYGAHVADLLRHRSLGIALALAFVTIPVLGLTSDALPVNLTLGAGLGAVAVYFGCKGLRYATGLRHARVDRPPVPNE